MGYESDREESKAARVCETSLELSEVLWLLGNLSLTVLNGDNSEKVILGNLNSSRICRLLQKYTEAAWIVCSYLLFHCLVSKQTANLKAVCGLGMIAFVSCVWRADRCSEVEGVKVWGLHGHGSKVPAAVMICCPLSLHVSCRASWHICRLAVCGRYLSTPDIFEWAHWVSGCKWAQYWACGDNRVPVGWELLWKKAEGIAKAVLYHISGSEVCLGAQEVLKFFMDKCLVSCVF